MMRDDLFRNINGLWLPRGLQEVRYLQGASSRTLGMLRTKAGAGSFVGGGVPVKGGGTTLRNNLVGAWVLTSANTGTRTTNLSQEVTKLGNLTNVGADEGATGYTFNSANSDVMYVSDAGVAGTDIFSVIMRFIPNSNTGNAQRLIIYNDSNTGWQITSNNGKYALISGDGSTTWGNNAAGPDRQRSANFADGNADIIALVVSTGSDKIITRSYVDKALLADTGDTSTYGVGSDQAKISIGARPTGVDTYDVYLCGVVSHLYIWNRALTAAECDSVADAIDFVLTEY
jgi:hypothetical protein